MALVGLLWSGLANHAGAQETKKTQPKPGGALLSRVDELTGDDAKDTSPLTPNSPCKVYKIKQETRDYAMLGELNTRPRTTYLGKIRNPNPEMIEA